MPRRRSNQNRGNANTTPTPSPARNNSAPPLEPPPTYFETIPQVHIERLVDQMSLSGTFETLHLGCRKWQFVTIAEFPPHSIVDIFGAIFRVEAYSGNYYTVVAPFSKAITEFHVVRVTEGSEVIWETAYRVVLPDRPWPEDGIRASNRDEYYS